ncbi:jg1198 [Pararge aegeria aegeria]|uniref:Jg1198 protein n=1 Tax=Pararge aegeria aegeria TaxID=348720 RepID=A0A8S4R9V7_9NEOP|nr:jg1198 [Pararge aegeria aegeria]
MVTSHGRSLPPDRTKENSEIMNSQIAPAGNRARDLLFRFTALTIAPGGSSKSEGTAAPIHSERDQASCLTYSPRHSDESHPNSNLRTTIKKRLVDKPNKKESGVSPVGRTSTSLSRDRVRIPAHTSNFSMLCAF